MCEGLILSTCPSYARAHEHTHTQNLWNCSGKIVIFRFFFLKTWSLDLSEESIIFFSSGIQRSCISNKIRTYLLSNFFFALLCKVDLDECWVIFICQIVATVLLHQQSIEGSVKTQTWSLELDEVHLNENLSLVLNFMRQS